MAFQKADHAKPIGETIVRIERFSKGKIRVALTGGVVLSFEVRNAVSPFSPIDTAIGTTFADHCSVSCIMEYTPEPCIMELVP